MGAVDDALAHLAKAGEFLAAAALSLEAGHPNAAASDAVLSGINAKDAICLKLTGTTIKADDHKAAAAELRRAGGAAVALESTFARLMRLKATSQYLTTSVSERQARDALSWAQRLHQQATLIVEG